MSDLQKGDIGVFIKMKLMRGDYPVDISLATLKEIIIKKPDNNSVTKQAIFEKDGKNGVIMYRILDGDLNQSGSYYAQAYIELPEYNAFSSKIKFNVEANLT